MSDRESKLKLPGASEVVTESGALLSDRQLAKLTEPSIESGEINYCAGFAAFGVVLAAPVYFSFLVACLFVYSASRMGMSNADFLSTIFFLVMALVFVMLVAAVATFISFMAVVPLGYFVRGLFNERSAVLCMGGLAGFLSTSWPAFIAPWGTQNFGGSMNVTPIFWATLYVAGAMLFGQVGGFLVAMGSEDYLARQLFVLRKKTRVVSVATGELGLYPMEGSSNSLEAQFQFGLRHLFAITVFAAVLLTIDRMLGGYRLLVGLSMYLTLQPPVMWLALRYLDGKEGRKLRGLLYENHVQHHLERQFSDPNLEPRNEVPVAK